MCEKRCPCLKSDSCTIAAKHATTELADGDKPGAELLSGLFHLTDLHPLSPGQREREREPWTRAASLARVKYFLFKFEGVNPACGPSSADNKVPVWDLNSISRGDRRRAH